ncbi:MAG: hypothetical protein KBD06_00185 [Candidatus Pacebacteria bacterium]|nr:hypothetical protein [Candidatus Paceibacterota bacterium]
MIEKPRESKKIDPIDRETLALLGHRIELWDSSRFAEASIEERKTNLETAIQAEIERLESSDQEVSSQELLELRDDLLDVQEFDGSPDEFNELCKERAEYYAAVRSEFLKTL